MVLINMITILMISARKATPGLLKIKFFEKKVVIIPEHDVTNKILSCDSNYNVNVVIDQSLVTLSSISVREVSITSIL